MEAKSHYPHQQPFSGKFWVKQCNPQQPNRSLHRRIADYNIMAKQPRIGDGHRDITGYHRPGSNKK